jgi:hypothetical protein
MPDKKDLQKNWKIQNQTHRRVKILCAQHDLTQDELAVRSLDAYENASKLNPEQNSGNSAGKGDTIESALQAIGEILEDLGIVALKKRKARSLEEIERSLAEESASFDESRRSLKRGRITTASDD